MPKKIYTTVQLSNEFIDVVHTSIGYTKKTSLKSPAYSMDYYESSSTEKPQWLI